MRGSKRSIYRLTTSLIGIALLGYVTILVLSQALTPLLAHYRPQLQQYVGQWLQHTVQLKHIHLRWHGIKPVLHFSDVLIQNPQATRVLLMAQHLEMGIAPLDSLLQRRFVPKNIALRGARMTLHSDTSGQVSIEGIQPDLDVSVEDLQALGKMLLVWSLTQSKVALAELDILWFVGDDVLLPLHNVSLQLFNRGDKHSLRGQLTLAQTVASQIQFSADFTGPDDDIAAWQGTLQVQGKSLLAAQWLQPWLGKNVTLKSGQFDVDLTAAWQDNQWQTVQANVQAHHVSIANQQSVQLPFMQHASAQLHWQKQAAGWQLTGRHIALQHGSGQPSGKQLSNACFHYQDQSLQAARKQTLILQQVLLQDVWPMFAVLRELPDTLQPALASLQPRGFIETLTWQRESRAEQPLDWSLKAQFRDVAVAPWGKWPAIAGLDGQMWLTDDGAWLNLHSDVLHIQAPTWFSQPLPTSQFSASLSWQPGKTDWQLMVEQWQLQNSILSVEGQIEVSSDRAQFAPQVHAYAIAETREPMALSAYVPDAGLDSGVGNWLRHAVAGGDALTAELTLRGPLKDFPFQLDLRAHNIDLHYWPGWPQAKNITGQLRWHHAGMQAVVEAGTLQTLPLKGLQIRLPQAKPGKIPVLSLQGKTQGNVQALQQLLLASPLSQSVPDLEQWQLRGPMVGQLAMQLPLAKSVAIKMNSTIDLKKVTLENVALPKKSGQPLLRDIQGKVHISEQVVQADRLSLCVLDNPAQMRITTEKNQQATYPLPPWGRARERGSNTTRSVSTTEKSQQATYPLPPWGRVRERGSNTTRSVSSALLFELTGSVDPKMLSQYVPSSVLGFLSGKTPISATLWLAADQANSYLRIQSTLQGLGLALPAPLQKQAEQRADLSLTAAKQGRDTYRIAVNYADQIQAVLALRAQDGQFDRGEWHWGKGHPTLPKQAGLLMTGQIPYLSFTDWQKVLQDQVLPDIDFETVLRQANVKIDQLELYGGHFNKLHLTANRGTDHWLLNVRNNAMKGQVMLPDLLADGVHIRLDRLYLKEKMKLPKDWQETIEPADIPPLDVVIRDFRYGQRPLGQLIFLTTGKKKQMQVKYLGLQAPHAKFEARGYWKRVHGKYRTALKGAFTSDAVADALKTWRVFPFLDSKKAKLEFDLLWPGAIHQFKMSKLMGEVDIAIASGRITQLDPEMQAKIGLGKLISILSLQTLAKRLRLDFRDLTQSGFPFNKVKGQFVLQSGKAITNSIAVTGNVADLDLSGEINLVKQDCRLQLYVDPHITSSLPVVAAIAGGPVAGVVTWVVDKIIDKPVQKMSEKRYKITGPWSAPQVVALH